MGCRGTRRGGHAVGVWGAKAGQDGFTDHCVTANYPRCAYRGVWGTDQEDYECSAELGGGGGGVGSCKPWILSHCSVCGMFAHPPPPHQGRLFLPQPLLLPFHGWAAQYHYSQIEEAFPILNQNLPSGYLYSLCSQDLLEPHRSPVLLGQQLLTHQTAVGCSPNTSQPQEAPVLQLHLKGVNTNSKTWLKNANDKC